MATKYPLEKAISQQTLGRLMEKIKRGPGDCWTWTAATNGGGYPAFQFRGQVRPAHHVTYLIDRGDWPGGDLTWECGNRRCVNPEHLILRAHAE